MIFWHQSGSKRATGKFKYSKNCLFLPANIHRCPESETARKTEKKPKIFQKPVNLKNHDFQT